VKKSNKTFKIFVSS